MTWNKIRYSDKHMLLFGLALVVGFFIIGTFSNLDLSVYNPLGSNDPNGDNELTLYEYIFTKYPNPKDLYDAVQRGDESYDNLPDDIVYLLNKTYNKNFSKGGLVVGVP